MSEPKGIVDWLAEDSPMARAREAERAATEALIVAYLRETCIITVRVGSPEAIAADIIANRIEAIERGEHRR